MVTILDAEAGIKRRLTELHMSAGIRDKWEAVHLEQAIRCLLPNDPPRAAFDALTKSRLAIDERSPEDLADFETTYGSYKHKTIGELEALLIEKSSALV